MGKITHPEATALRQEAEALLKSKASKISLPLSEADTLRLIHELEVHQIELEMQNEELKRASELATIASESYVELYDFAPNGYFTLSTEGEILMLNFAGAKMLGKERSKINGRLFQLYLADDSKPLFRSFLAKVFNSKVQENCELSLLTTDNLPLYIYLTGIVNENGDRCYATAIDISIRRSAEAARYKSEALQRKMVSNIGDVIVIIDQNGINRYKSPNITRLFGWDPDELTGKSAWDVVHPDDLGYTKQFVDNLVKEEAGATKTTEIRYRCKDGKYVWIEVTLVNLLSDPDIQGILGNYHDITERKLLEDTQSFLLQISNPESDRTFFESLAHYLAQSLEMEYVCIDLLEGDGLKAQTLAIYNDGNFDPNVSYTLKDTPCGEVVGNHICCYPKEVCRLFPYDAALKEIKAESYIGTTLVSFDGQPIGLIAVIGQKPIQNQKLASTLLKLVSVRAAGKLEAKLVEDKLRESEERFRVLIESTSVAIYLTDLKGKCTYVNPKWCEMAHLTPDQAMNDGWINGIYEEDRAKVLENWEKMVASDGHWGFESRFGTPDHISWVIGTAKSYKNDSGEIAGFIGSNLDITDRKQMEQDLIIAKEHAEQSDHLKTAFLANMSHEIRTPMNGILGFASLLKEPNLTGEEQQDYINIIEKSGDRMLSIINDIVNISKIEAGLMEVDWVASNINEQIDFIHTFFKPLAGAKGILLTCHKGLLSKESIIITDKEKVYGILTNLVKNAIKFTDKGSIELGYELVAGNNQEPAVEKIHEPTVEKIHEFSLQQKRAPFLQFYVKDTGIGIAADRQNAIFERFIQEDIHDVNARQGAGLGLAISKAYTEMLGGGMWIESKKGAGSTFFFTLPYKRIPQDQSAPSTKGLAPVSAENIPSNALNINVLIVDDDEISAGYLATIATGFSSNIIQTKSGREAVNACQNDAGIDLILMDIKMADMDGYEATRQIRQFNSAVIILAQTAHALTGDKERALEAGCNDYIEKPINRFQLIGLVNKYFNKPAL